VLNIISRESVLRAGEQYGGKADTPVDSYERLGPVKVLRTGKAYLRSAKKLPIVAPPKLGERGDAVSPIPFSSDSP